MKKEMKVKLFLAAVLFSVAAILTILVCTVDVAEIGPNGTSIGLSHLNQWAFEALGVNMIWYTVTDWLGLTAILSGCIFAWTGLTQWIRRRSLLKVDRNILLLGGLYLAAAAIYVLFELVVINYRPVVLPGCEVPEASFPSSHTMLVCTLMGSAIMTIRDYVRNASVRIALQAMAGAVIGITILGRLISGVHWLTDIIAGVLISASLLALYAALASEPEDHGV